MTKYIKCGGGGLPPQVITDMNAVLNKKFGTSTDYPSSSWPSNIEKMTALPEESASGSIAHFTDGADTVPLKSCTLTLAPTQSGTGDPSPTNPRPITGVSSVNVTNNGANFWNEEWEVGSLTASGGDYASTTRIRSVGYTEVPQNATFYAFTNGYTADIHFYDENETHISYVQKTNTTFTTPPNTKYIRFCMSVAYGTTYNNDISINGSATDTTYHAYVVPTLAPVSLGTVYGGEVECVGGEVTKTDEIIDMGDISWTYSGGVFRGVISDGVILTQANIIDFVCSCYLVKGSGNSGKWTSDNLVCWHGTGSSCYIYVNDTNYNDADVFKTAVTGQKLVYKLATPTTAQITPTAINSRYGVNNLWCDGGDTSVEYRADIDLYVAEHS